MFAQISLVMLAWLSHLNPAAEDLIELMERVAMTEQAERFELRGSDLSDLSDLNDLIAAVQIELLPDHESAVVLAADLQRSLDEQLGGEFQVFVETVRGDAELPPSYRVGVGPFHDFEQAESAQLVLERLGFDGFVRELDAVIGC